MIKDIFDTVTWFLLDLFAPNIEKNRPSGKRTSDGTENGTQENYSVQRNHRKQIKPHFEHNMYVYNKEL